MPDLEGALPLILLMIFLWVRSIGAAMKRNRQRQEQALGEGPDAGRPDAGRPDAEAAGSGGEALQLPGMPEAPDAGVATPPPGRRPGLREQLREMGRQLEQQMQQAADEGRPGSMVGHVDPEEAPEMPGMLRPTASRAPVRPAPPPFDAAASAPASASSARTRPRAVPVARSPSRRSGRAQPLARFERYPPLSRAVILSEILGRPPGLSDDRDA